MKKRFRLIAFVFIIFFSSVFAFSACAPSLNAENLMKSIKSNAVVYKTPDDKFKNSAAEFSVELFKQAYLQNDVSNSLISPLSVLLALAMTANGAGGTTLSEMENVLAGGMSLNELNDYLYSYRTGLKSEKKSKLGIANSIWFRDGFAVENDFLQVNADYYNAAAYRAAFDKSTIDDVNKWVKYNTDGLIDKIIDEISGDDIMYLINTILFDAQWKTAYKDDSIQDGKFTDINGIQQDAKFMHGYESLYLDGVDAKGFIKPYFGGHYGFAALLPNEDIVIGDYVDSLSGEGFMSIIKNARTENVRTALPQFEYEYELGLSDTLTAMGIKDAFLPSKADFSKMGNADGNIYIEDVLHKTYISVDAKGTKAAAVTKVGVGVTSAPPPELTVILDRPFVYAIIDIATGLPLFIGILNGCKK